MSGRIFAVCLLPLLLRADYWAGPRLDAVIEAGLADNLAPGAVLLAGRGERVLHLRAYGSRGRTPGTTDAMRTDTIFDCASLTKVVVTTPAVMMLVEEGRLRLDDRVTEYLPRFSGGASRITVRQLLTHSSGLRPDLDLEPEWSGYDTGIEKAYRETPVAAPGETYVYSDINYILLAEIVRELSGMPLDEFARERIFKPLDMNDSMFNPPAESRVRIAPTERLKNGEVLLGVVHDPTTRFMGGVSGHAGLFSTAADLARFSRMMLRGGELDGRRVLSPLSVAAMTRRQSPAGLPARGLGWDIDSPYASPRGDLFAVGSYGHTGYTGTSIWIDPTTRSYLILMTNRVHPTVKTSVVSLRSRLASAFAASLELPTDAASHPEAAARRSSEVLTGLDVLVRDGFRPLRGKRVGLITNHTGIDREGRRNVDLLLAAPGVELVALFSPEHGFEGTLDYERVVDSSDHRSGLRIHSLYQGDRRRPTPEMLEGIDALVFDIQDVGARFYTYLTTMAYAMEEAAKAGVAFYVLDRPNPIRGDVVEGPLLDDSLRSFIGYFRMPVRHGLTVGEAARMFNEINAVGADLRVIRMEGWARDLWFDQTQLPWVDPSPNIRSLNQAILYPGVALLEGLKNLSVGRGTEAPFEFVGADWADARRLARELNRGILPGLRAYPLVRVPASSILAGREARGVHIQITDREAASPTRLGLELAAAIARLFPNQVDFEQTRLLIGDRETLDDLRDGVSALAIWERWQRESAEFDEQRRPFLLY